MATGQIQPAARWNGWSKFVGACGLAAVLLGCLPSFEVIDSADCATCKPNLSVEHFYMHYKISGTSAIVCLNRTSSGTNVAQGDYITTTNKGSASAAEYSIGVGFKEITNGARHHSSTRLHSTSTQEPGEEHTWDGPTCAGLSNLPASTYRLLVTVDVDDDVDESNEGNNDAIGSDTISID